jgi:8-oxo-dGTP pyrophosphatase MutT (NUDIX family)
LIEMSSADDSPTRLEDDLLNELLEARGGAQVLPRPPDVSPGPAPTWVDISLEQRRSISIDQVRSAIDGIGSDAPTDAAVLILLFERDGELQVVFTRRAQHLRSHRGEVSFPGGRHEAGESDVVAALREANEEIALDVSTIEVIGQLRRVRPFVSNRAIRPVVADIEIQPIVAYSAGVPQMIANPDEVERIFEVSLSELMAAEAHRSETWNIPGVGFHDIHIFEVEDDTIWGATARILVEFLDRVARVVRSA